LASQSDPHASRLFVGDAGEDHVPLQRHPALFQHHQNGSAHRRHILHVDGATPPKIPVLNAPFEGGDPPLSFISFNDV